MTDFSHEPQFTTDKNGNLLHAEAYGNRIETHPDGSATITRPDGTVLKIEKEGGVSIENFTPKSFGLDNLADLKSYVITEDDGVVKHSLLLKDGGTYELIYNTDGTFVKSSGTKVSMSLSVDGIATLSMQKPS